MGASVLVRAAQPAEHLTPRHLVARSPPHAAVRREMPVQRPDVNAAEPVLCHYHVAVVERRGLQYAR